ALSWIEDVVGGVVGMYVSAEVFPEEWDLEALLIQLHATYPSDLKKTDLEEIHDPVELTQKVLDEAVAVYERREQELGVDVMRELERMVVLSVVDTKWREHLYEMDYLEEGIHLRAYGQRDPLVEYQNEAHKMFEAMKASIEDEFVKYIYRVELVRQDEPARPRPQRLVAAHGKDEARAATGQITSDKVPRNAPCPCGSGKKYKKCHGLSA
ncbi:MAG: SEC-C metal-binding domain-containing protein, partial [Actinomycetota bacterium]|nr:SEC-C metal-binding domain-containing protein [Actinomycetota bacterium]